MRTTRILALVALLIAATLGTLGVVALRSVESDWAALRARVDAVEARVEQRSDERPVLHGEARPGEAFEHYRRALALLSKHVDAGRAAPSLTEVLAADADAQGARARLALEVAPVLRELRLGATSRRARLPLDWDAEELLWDGSVDVGVLDASAVRRLARVAFSVALTELADGRSDEALALLLDALQFARDLAATPLLAEAELGAGLLVPEWLEAFGEDGGWSCFSEEERARWLGALATVDDGLATVGDGIAVDTALTVRGLEAYLTAAAADGHPASRLAGWLLGEMLKADTHDEHVLLLDFEQEYVAAFDSEPLRGPNLVHRRYERRTKGAEGYVQIPLMQFRDRTSARLHGLVRLRLLRHALAALAERDDAPVAERLGLPILSERVDGVQRSSIEPGCKQGGLCCPSVIAISIAETLAR